MHHPTSRAVRRGLAAAAALSFLLPGVASPAAGAAPQTPTALVVAVDPAPTPAPSGGSDPAVEGVRFAASPAAADGRDGRARFTYTLDPGQRIDDFLAVSNRGTAAQTFDVYAADAFHTDAGEYALRLGDEPAEGAGLWFDLGAGLGAEGHPAHTQVTVEPGATVIVPFSVTAPADASPGDHGAGLVVSRVSTGEAVLVEHRVATRAYLRVTGPLQPAITVGGLNARYGRAANPLDGTVHVTYTLSNTGNVALDSRVSAWVDSAIGGRQLAAIAPVEAGELLPGETRTLTADILEVPEAGPLVLHVRLDPFVGPESELDPGPVASAERELRLFAVPWAAIVVLLVVVALVVLAVWRGRRRKARHTAELARAREEGALAAHVGAVEEPQR